jgi:hypothetical protein
MYNIRQTFSSFGCLKGNCVRGYPRSPGCLLRDFLESPVEGFLAHRKRANAAPSARATMVSLPPVARIDRAAYKAPEWSSEIKGCVPALKTHESCRLYQGPCALGLWGGRWVRRYVVCSISRRDLEGAYPSFLTNGEARPNQSRNRPCSCRWCLPRQSVQMLRWASERTADVPQRLADLTAPRPAESSTGFDSRTGPQCGAGIGLGSSPFRVGEQLGRCRWVVPSSP